MPITEAFMQARPRLRLTQTLVDSCDVLMLLGEPNSDVNMGIVSQIAGAG
jgi:hypothetical protein